MSARAMNGYFALALATAIGTYGLIVFGAVVRVTGSGLGCPDWPLCHGRFLPPLEMTAIIEYTHRFIGAVISPLILATAAFAWLRRPRQRQIVVPATLVPPLLVAQIVLGKIVVELELPSMAVLVHLGFAMVIFGLICWLTVFSAPAPRVDRTAAESRQQSSDQATVPSGLYRLIWITTLLVFGLIMTGALVRATDSTWACVGFPTCNGDVLPFGTSRQVDIHLFHRLVAYAGAWMVLWTLAQTYRRSDHVPALKRAAGLAGLAALTQVAIGATAVTIGVPPLFQALHVAGAAAVWAAVVCLAALATRARRTEPVGAVHRAGDEAPSRQVDRRGVAAAYIALTKPRVMSLLLITTLASMMVAAGGMPALNLVFFTLLGGALSAGGAGAINHYLDRDIDLLMGRTADRPIPAGAVPPRHALAFGIALGVASFILMTVFVNLLAATLSLGALLFYVFVYTRWLKRTTPSNIVIGGAAGAVPPIVGVAAVSGEVTLLALYLFAIVFFWTPPHFWALALLMRQEYARAKVPMLPIVRGEEETRRQILLYSLQLVVVTIVMYAFGLAGQVYLLSALALGGLFIYYAVRLWRDRSAAAARRLFKYSLLYLTLLFTAMVVDRQLLL
jgi:protoheme IX farnesyltransferase